MHTVTAYGADFLQSNLQEPFCTRVAAALMTAWVECCVLGGLHAYHAELRVHAILLDVKDHNLVLRSWSRLCTPLYLFISFRQ